MAAPKTYVNVSGVWKGTNDIYTRVGGVWKIVDAAYVNVSGVWKLVHQHVELLNLTISSNVTSYNIFSAAGSPAGPHDVTLTINAGISVFATNTSTPGITTGGFAAGSIIRIINNGFIYSQAGSGGTDGSRDGTAAGIAIKCDSDTFITNGSGNVWAGGGGGAFDLQHTCGMDCFIESTDGGNGQGEGAPAPGTRGGLYGEPGTGGVGGGLGGAGGISVQTNGNSLTWVSGNTGARVKGAQT
jgi:hypothetical protein